MSILTSEFAMSHVKCSSNPYLTVSVGEVVEIRANYLTSRSAHGRTSKDVGDHLRLINMGESGVKEKRENKLCVCADTKKIYTIAGY